jgi:hypothetical protein
MGLRPMEGVARSATGDGLRLRLAGMAVNRPEPSSHHAFATNIERISESQKFQIA